MAYSNREADLYWPQAIIVYHCAEPAFSFLIVLIVYNLVYTLIAFAAAQTRHRNCTDISEFGDAEEGAFDEGDVDVAVGGVHVYAVDLTDA